MYDGGGVAPDVDVQNREIADITRVLIQKSYLFDYATRYRAEHATIAPARDFKLADADYQKFVAFMQTKGVTYSTDAERALTDLTKKVKEEKHYDDVKPELEAIKRKVTANKANDLLRFKPEIREMLEEEIASRYYYEKGPRRSGLRRRPQHSGRRGRPQRPQPVCGVAQAGGRAASATKSAGTK
ncbi:MAG: hypothetical protein WKG07_01365 [Hymenobacter sp.]